MKTKTKTILVVSIPVTLVSLLIGTCIGCEPDIEKKARDLVDPFAIPSAAMAVMTGTGEQLVERGRIDSFHRIPGVNGVEIDVWVINDQRDDPRPSPTSRATGGPPPRPTARGTVVLLPPLLTCKSWFLDAGGLLAERGWDVVLIDHRGHGWSAGEHVTWGAKEKHDVKAVMEALIADGRVSERVLAVGASMGGMISIQYAAIDPRVRGVLALAPPASFRRIARRIHMMLSDSDCEAAVKRAAEMADFDPDEADTVAAASKLTCPLILVHGWLDWAVPYDHSKDILAAARGPTKLIDEPTRGHAVEVMRNEWVVERIEELAGMAGMGERE